MARRFARFKEMKERGYFGNRMADEVEKYDETRPHRIPAAARTAEAAGNP